MTSASTPPELRRARGRERRRPRLASLERPLLLAGLTLVAAHLLDVALAGPETTPVGVAGIVVVAGAAAALQPHVTRATRAVLAIPLGIGAAAAGGAAHVLDLFTSGPRWSDVTGVGFALGGVLLVAAGVAALLAPRTGAPARSLPGRAAHVAAWLAGAFVVAQFVVLPLAAAVVATHAARLPVDADALDVARETVRIPAPGGELAAWYVPPRDGAAVLLVHGAGGGRATVADRADLLAGHGYGVLSVDLPGHGESDGRASLLGANAQPAIAAAIGWLAQRPGVDRDRIAAFGTSLGGEVLLEAAARDRRLRAVVSEGAQRPADDRRLGVEDGLAAWVGAVGQRVTRELSGMREPPPLLDLVGRIAPRPVLLIAAGGRPHEIRVNRAYRRAAGAGARLWALPEADHVGGLTARPAEYEERVIAFLDRALRRPRPSA